MGELGGGQPPDLRLPVQLLEGVPFRRLARCSSRVSTESTRVKDREAQPGSGVATSRRARGGLARAPFELPPDQARALALISAAGIPDAQLATRLGMAIPAAARVRAALLRRRLVHLVPAGPAGADSRLVPTARGLLGLGWLEQLPTALPPTLFDPVGPLPDGPFRVVDAISRSARSAAARPGAGRGASRYRPPHEHREFTADFETDREEIFQRGLINVTLGTGLFGCAALIGILQQSERAVLVSLGVGGFLAVVFFLRASAVLFRPTRAQAGIMSRWRTLTAALRSTLRRPQPPSGRALG